MNTKISIIVPIYNEIKIIDKFLDKLILCFKNLEIKYIFVDDGSDDGTQKWLKENIPQLFKNQYYELIFLEYNKFFYTMLFFLCFQ